MGETLRSWFKRVLQAPPGWPTFVVAVAFCGIGLWSASFPTGAFFLLYFGSALPLAGLGLWWLVRMIVAAAWGNWSWKSAFAPGAVAVAATLILLGVPLQLRLQYVKSDFEALVAERYANPNARWERRKVAGYEVVSTRHQGKNWYFVIEGSGFMDDDGIAYLPDGPPAVPDNVGEGVKVGHISGPWYWFSAGW